MTDDGRTQRSGTAPRVAVEQRDMPVRLVALLLAGLVAALLLVCSMVAGMLMLFDHHAAPAAPPAPPMLVPPEPRLQVHEPTQRRRLEAAAEAATRRAPGRQGIDAAMRHVAARGWDATEGGGK